jgi:predicted PurR-regulated permease PerM
MSAMAFGLILIGGLCAILSVETLDLVNSLPRYRENIIAKWSTLQKGPPGPLSIAFRNIGDLVADLSKMNSGPQRVEQNTPMKVQIVSGADSALELAKNSMAPVLGPISEFAVVAVLVVFILFERKRFRGRFLRLIGHSHVVTTTLAVDEAGSRLSSFLLMQLAVNSGYALVVAIGLYFIGIPNAILWAVLTLALRFLPYVGLWISAFCPLLLSIAISTSWTPPLLTFLLYLVLELFTNNVIEPFVLGGSTGISPLAVIISALFWTWLWGPVGLLLSTPIASCLVVLGRYFPAFHPYSVLLAADPPTSSETKLIRLLTESRLAEAKALVHALTAMELSVKTAEEVIVPTVRTIENELFPGTSANPTKGRIYEQMREMIDELTIVAPNDLEEPAGRSKPEPSQLVIVPLIGEGDEIIAKALALLLDAESIPNQVLSWRALRSEKVEKLRELGARYVLFSVVESRSATAVAKMIRSIQSSLPETVFVVGLWSLPLTGAARLTKKIREVAQGGVCTNIEQAIRTIVSLLPPRALDTDLEPTPPQVTTK